jgi:hypothetical protein
LFHAGAARTYALSRTAIAAGLALAVTIIPAVLALAGVDLFAARNVVPGLVPVAALVAAGGVVTRPGTAALAILTALSVAVVITGATDPQLQRADWRGLSHAIDSEDQLRALVMTPGKDPGPFSVYLSSARPLPASGAHVAEVDVAAVATQGTFSSGHAKPPRPGARLVSPAGFRLVERRTAESFTLLRFATRHPRRVWPFELARLELDPAAGASIWLVGG